MSSTRRTMWRWAIPAILIGGGVAGFIMQRRDPPEPRQPPAAIAPRFLPPPMAAPGRGRSLATGVDLNTASLSQLETLPGMTADYARKIIAARPFHDRSELVRAGIPLDVFERMSPPAYLKFDVPGGIPPR